MCKKIFVVAILVLIVGVLVPNCALAANNFNNGELTLDTAWSGSLQDELLSLGIFGANVNKLNITAGEITDDDVIWISKNMMFLKELNISGSAYFTDNNLPDHSFCGFSGSNYVLNKLEKVVINPTNSELHFARFAFNCSDTDDSHLVSVDIPNAKTFGFGAFHYNHKLTTVNLPNATSFGDHSFSFCKELTTINLTKVTTFGSSTFYACEKLTSVSMPEVVTFGDGSFVSCKALASISFPKATTFGEGAFRYTESLVSVSLPEATTFGDYAFDSAKSLVNILLPKATTFGKNAFGSCTSLETVSLPALSSVGEYLFLGSKAGIYMTLGAVPPTMVYCNYALLTPQPRIKIPNSAFSAYVNVNDNNKTGWYGFKILTKHNVYYNGNGNDGGTVPVDPELYYEGDTVTVLGNTGNLTRTGYTFQGWVGVGSTFKMGDNIRTLCADWDAIQYTVTFNSNGGSNVNDMVRLYNTPISSQPYCSRAGYNLVGWYKESTFVNKVTFPYTVLENQRLHAKWEVAQCTVHFNTDGGSYVSSVTQNPNTTIDAAPVTTRTGHTFDGWYTDSMFFNKVTFPYTITYNTTLYAKWIADQHTISFNTNGGSSVSAITQGYDSMIDEPICNKVGYSLEGWYTEATFENRVWFPYIINGDATLYAKWTVNQYVIDFDVAGGSHVDPIFQNYNTTIATSPVTTKVGYTLEGWYKEDTFINKVTFPYTITDNAILYAKWTGVPYTISFYVDGGSAVNAITQGYNSTINEPVCNKAGHSFKGWYAEATFVNKITFPYSVEGNATLYAKWEIEQYTISFDVAGGSAVNAVTQNYNTTIDICPVTTKANYTFDGWYKEDTFVNKVSFPYTITSDAILYAKWSEIKVGDISFSSSDGTYNIGVTDFITVNITPSNALNQNIIVTNLNSNVASVVVDSMDPHKIWIEALEEGRTEITVATEDGSVSKTCVVVVVKPDVAEPETPQGGIVGALVDSNGDPLVGYYITLHSTPVTVVTDSNGKFAFPEIQFTSHTMIVESPTRSELARFAVSMVQGANTSSMVDNDINSIDITYANTTLNINVDLQAADPMGTDFNIAQVGFAQKPTNIPVVNGRVENPATGERVENSNIRLLIMSIVVIGLFASLMTIRSRRYRDK